jgi:bifunctional ADP-heptose synthase (sugar kinase/adenylyltransferase)
MTDRINRYLEQFRDLNVLVIGETIIDEFVTVAYEGQSMKSICPVYSLSGERSVQQGGTLAIANHLRGFVKKLDLITNENNEIVKTRYVDRDDGKKHVEINKFEVRNFKKISVKTSDYDVVIVADFGHGFCDNLVIDNGFHLMCQTNSNNFGFNRISKWKKHSKRSVCLDLREASLQMNKKIKFESEEEILELYNYEINAGHLFLTIGRAGSAYTNGVDIVRQRTFESEVVDTIGAGDTFYAFACLMSALKDVDLKDIMLIPALAASLSTTWLCNEKSVTPQSLLSHANRFVH